MKKSVYAIILVVIAICFYFYETQRNEDASQHILEQEDLKHHENKTQMDLNHYLAKTFYLVPQIK
ncbi:DNA/RNA non-specific endonuclease [Nonlabens ulvanivorans]|nr:hypothetical protein [Nonlabens ulvanivorans]GAK88738.1 DNA/RNA non-specific endonuclease [Nonlabens ulvanivorans]